MRILIFIIVIIFLSCDKSKKSSSKNVLLKGIMIERTFPVMDFDSLNNKWIVLRYDPFYTKIYTDKNITLIQTNYYHRELNSPTEALLNKEFNSRYYSYFFTDQSDNAVLCDSNNIQRARFVNKDSMLGKEWALNIDQERLFRDNDYDLISSENTHGNYVVENYLFRNKKDTTLKGKMQFIFSKENISVSNYSLAKGIEEKRRMRLLKTDCINYERRIGSTNAFIDEVRVVYELKEIEINWPVLSEMFKYAKNLLEKN